MNFRITEINDPHGYKYCAVIVGGMDLPLPAIFSGRGNTIDEAVGSCLISNREALGFTFIADSPSEFLLQRVNV